jgi:hypothetical protein
LTIGVPLSVIYTEDLRRFQTVAREQDRELDAGWQGEEIWEKRHIAKHEFQKTKAGLKL